MGINDFGDGLEGELFTGDTDEFGDDESDNSKHGLTAVFEFGFTEPVEPLGSALLLGRACVGERNGVARYGRSNERIQQSTGREAKHHPGDMKNMNGKENSC